MRKLIHVSRIGHGAPSTFWSMVQYICITPLDVSDRSCTCLPNRSPEKMMGTGICPLWKVWEPTMKTRAILTHPPGQETMEVKICYFNKASINSIDAKPSACIRTVRPSCCCVLFNCLSLFWRYVIFCLVDERTQSGLPPLDFSGEGRKLSGTGGLVSECDYFFMADMRVGQGGEALTSRGSSFPSGASRRSPGLGSRWEDDRDGSKYPSLALSRSPPARRGDYGRREDRFPDSSDLRAIIEEERNRKLGASGWSDMSDDLAYYEKGRGKRDHDESPSRDEKRNKYSRKDDRKTPGARRVLSVAAQELMEEEDDDERGRYVRGSFARKEKEDDGDRHYQNYDLASLPSSREKAVFSRDYDTRDKDPRERQYEGFRRRSLSPLKDRSLDERYDLSSRAGDSDRLDGRYGRSSTPEKWSRSDSPTRPSYREKSREYLRSDSRTSGGRYSNDRDGRLDERYGRDSKRRREDRGRGPYDRDKSAHSDESAASYGVSSAFDVLSEKAVLRASSGEKHLTALELGRPFFGKRRSDLSDRDGSLDRDGKRPEEKAAKTKTSHSSRVGEEDYYDYIYDKRDGKKPSVHVSSRTLDKQDLADDRYPTLYSDRPESYLMDRSSPPPSSAKESKDTSSAKQQDTRNSASLAGEATGVRGRGRGTSPFRGRGRGTAYRARGTAYRGRGTAFRGRGRGGTFVPRGRGRAYRARGFRGSPRGSFVRGRGRGGDMRDSCPPAWVRGGRMRGRNVFAPPGRERRDRDSDDDYSSPDEARKYSSRTSHHRSPERSPSRDRTDDKKRFNRSASREDAKRSPSPEYRLKDGAEDKERFKKSTSREDVKRSRSPEYKPKERTEDKKRSNKSTSKESAKRSPSPEYKPKDRTEDKKRFNKSTSKEDVKRSPSPEYRPRKEPKGYVPRKAKESRTELDTKASEKKVGQNSASSKEADKRDAKDKKKHSAHGKSHSKKAHSKAHRRRRSGSSSSSSSPSSCSCSDSSWSSSSSSSDSDSSDESRSKAKSATKEAGSEQTVGQRKRIVIQLSSKDKRSVVMSGKGKTPIRGKEMDDQESKKVAEKVPGKKDDSASKGNTKGSASSGAVAVSVSGRKRKGPTKPGPARPPGQGAQARMPGPVTHRLNSMSLKQQNKLIESFWALEAEPEEEEPPKELAVKDIKVEKADVDPLYSETQPARQRANDETRQDVKADIRIVVDKRSSREAYHGGQREKYVVGEKAPRTQAKSGKPSKRKVPIRTGEEPSESKAVEAEDYQQLGSTASYNVAAKESAEQQPQVTRRRGSNLISIIPDPNAFAKAAQQRTKLQHKQTAPTRRTASDQSRLAPVEAETRVRHSAALTAHSHRDAGISERTKPQHKHTAPTPRTASVQSRLAPVEDETRVRHLAALTAHSHRDAGISERTKPQRKQTAPTRRTASDQPGLAPVEAQARVRHSAALTSHLRRDSGISERAKIQSEHVNEEVPAQQHYEYGYYGEEQAADHDWGQGEDKPGVRPAALRYAKPAGLTACFLVFSCPVRRKGWVVVSGNSPVVAWRSYLYVQIILTCLAVCACVVVVAAAAVISAAIVVVVVVVVVLLLLLLPLLLLLLLLLLRCCYCCCCCCRCRCYASSVYSSYFVFKTRWDSQNRT